MTAWIAILAGLLGLAAGIAITVYLGRMTLRHEKHLAYRAFAVTLKRHAEGIGEETDPRRVAAGLRLDAERIQRQADALLPDAGHDTVPVRSVGWGPFRLPWRAATPGPR